MSWEAWGEPDDYECQNCEENLADIAAWARHVDHLEVANTALHAEIVWWRWLLALSTIGHIICFLWGRM